MTIKKISAIKDVTAEKRPELGLLLFRLYCFCAMDWMMLIKGRRKRIR